ncbi:branched-chain alpha-keto acid dehydrogenase subunit E2 [Paenibacillus swuensis]|uniref:Dihydrolipoamide acetyltransferase component of pyruvate dehydrogenase complex n=1 Tax=Paenibacillus swuensis TaxID=1178515 RepID=A0A172TLW2_9BACL|nr:dihydrolipoamide acetyltransferase family protein [Paenibacillus swuensis]ANE48045.1 branched-chain alpha-keto acid dehydrogenase subunit E2 [Paenibacillus swuensis]
MTKELEIIVPQLAESLVSATIGKWLKQPGDYVEEYEVLCEIFTDKVNAELPSTAEGVLKRILVREGENVPVGTPICIIEAPAGAATAGGAGNASDGGSQAAAGAQSAAHASGVSSAAGAPGSASLAAGGVAAAHAAPVSTTPSSSREPGMRGRYSPAVQTLAAEHGVDLRLVSGTGLDGRISRKDVLAYIAEGKPTPPAQAPAAYAAAPTAQAAAAPSAPLTQSERGPLRTTGIHLSQNPPLPDIEVEGQQIAGRSEYFIDVTPIRNTIARNMRQSVTEIPHAWTMIEVDVTNLVQLRNKWKDEFKRKEGVNLTYLAFLIKAVVSAIKDYPIMNSVWAVDKIIVKRDINISLAVGTEDSVLTPVIQKADQKNIPGIAREIEELSTKTRAGKLKLDELLGGTFTINNTGSFGSILSYPIINYPQAAILTFESIVKKPVVINDMIAVRSMANLCLSLDHRILDGVICGRFLQRVKENLEGYNAETNLY